jgi:hypothetical protein
MPLYPNPNHDEVLARAACLPPVLLAALIDVSLPLLEGRPPHEYIAAKHLRWGERILCLLLTDTTAIGAGEPPPPWDGDA